MSEQRIPFSIREEARIGLMDWWADRIDTAFFNHICSNSAQTDTRFTGHNATTASATPTGFASFVAPGGHSTTASVTATASNDFVLELLDVCIDQAKVQTPPIRPIMYGGDPYYVAFLHPHQIYSVRTDNSADRVTWYDAQKAAMQGGDVPRNPIFTGAHGVYNQVVIHESTRVPESSTTDVRMGAFCGAQAASIAFGQGYGPGQMSWVEELFDYENQLGVSAGLIWGMKKMVFNSADFGAIQILTHAAVPTALQS